MAVFIDDEIVSDDKAFVHFSDMSMQRGYGVFDFLRTIHLKPLFIDDHIDRFFRSSEAMHLDVKKSKKELKTIIFNLIDASFSETGIMGIRMMLSGGYSPDFYTLSDSNLIVSCLPSKVSNDVDFQNGISIITYPHQREMSEVKSINYQKAVWLQPLVKSMEAQDVLYYHNDFVTEFPRANVFIVNDSGVLVTPANNILEGITRKHIVSIAEGIMEVEIRELSLTEFKNASEVFLTSTTKRILPVLKVDQRMIGNGRPGPFTVKLNEKFKLYEQANIL